MKLEILNLIKNLAKMLIDLFIRNKHASLLLIMTLFYIAYFTSATFLKHENFYTGRFDLGNMDQTVWNTMNGRVFQMTDPDSTKIVSRLAYHADFILILLSPFYLIWSDPKVLLFIQTLVLAVGAVFVYLISNHILKNKNLSLTFSFAYLINPAVQYTNLYDFHAVTLATTFLLGAFYFLLRKKYFLFLIFSVLSALTKEQVWMTISLFGIYIAVSRFTLSIILNRTTDFRLYLLNKIKSKEVVLGSIMFLISVSIFYYVVQSAIPNSRGATHFALSYYSEFGNSPVSIIKNIIFSPDKTINILMEKEKIDYFRQLFSPLGYLSLGYPVLLIFSLPDFVINLFSNNKNLYQIYYQYTATITPFIFISAIYTIRLLNKIFPKISQNFFAVYIIAFSIYGAYLIGPLPGARHAQLDMLVKQYQNKEYLNNFLLEIPKGYSVAASNNIGAHLSQREKIYTIPVGLYEADYVIFLLNDPSAQPSLPAQKEMAKKLKSNKNYKLLAEKEEFVVFRKR